MIFNIHSMTINIRASWEFPIRKFQEPLSIRYTKQKKLIIMPYQNPYNKTVL